MVIGGLQKLTLLDYPTKVACTVFTYGCNYRCPFCHNASLVTDKPEGLLSEIEVLTFLKKRVGVLDGVCITGGEPLLQPDIEKFIAEIKSLGYSVKLDTNGSYPDRLRSVVEKKLVDYVAMDVKNAPERYSDTTGVITDVNKIDESVKFLLTGACDYEFRTTVIKEFHDVESITRIGEWIKGAKRYFLQNFVNSGNLIGKASGVDEQILYEMLAAAKKFVPDAQIRGL